MDLLLTIAPVVVMLTPPCNQAENANVIQDISTVEALLCVSYAMQIVMSVVDLPIAIVQVAMIPTLKQQTEHASVRQDISTVETLLCYVNNAI